MAALLHHSTFNLPMLRGLLRLLCHWTFITGEHSCWRDACGRWTLLSEARVCTLAVMGLRYLFTWHQLVNSTWVLERKWHTKKKKKKKLDKPVSIKSLAVKRKSSSHSFWQCTCHRHQTSEGELKRPQVHDSVTTKILSTCAIGHRKKLDFGCHA